MASLLLAFTGDAPLFRILDFLIEHKGRDFSKTEIAKGAVIARATLFKHWPAIEKHGIVRITRRYGKTKLYTLDSASPIVKKLLELERELIATTMETHARKNSPSLKKIAAENP